MTKRPFIAAFALLILLPIADAFAWNSPGHMTVALIAYRRLSDAQKQQVSDILKHHPHYDQYLVKQVPEGTDKDEWAFVMASTWPDWVRSAAPGDPAKSPAVTKYNHSSWHYITIDFVPGPDKKHPDRADFKPNKREPSTRPDDSDIVRALDDSMKKLSAQSDATAEDKAVALAWLIHLVGDIHQPLHACSMYSPQFPGGDKGGNDQAIRYNGKVVNLHTFWDDILMTYDYRTDAGISYVGIDFLASRITSNPANSAENSRELKSNTTAASWAKESHDLAVAFAYLNGTLESVPMADVRSKKVTDAEVPPLAIGYEPNTRAVAEHRAAFAGMRLADSIAALFKN